MAYTIYEYSTLAPNGEPVEGNAKRTASQALDTPVQLDSATVYAVVVPDADMHLRISPEGTAATTADHKLTAGDGRGFHVAQGARPYLYGIAAA